MSRVIAGTAGAWIYTSSAMESISGLLDLRREGKVTFESFQLRAPSLEDVFLKQTGRTLEA